MNTLLDIYQLAIYYVLVNTMFEKLYINLVIDMYWIAIECVLNKLIIYINKPFSMYHLISYNILVSAIINKLCIDLPRDIYSGIE